MAKLTNIDLKNYRKFLKSQGCKCNRQKGGHEHWSRSDLNRPLTLQSHISPIPPFIIKQHLKYLQITNTEFTKIIDSL